MIETEALFLCPTAVGPTFNGSAHRVDLLNSEQVRCQYFKDMFMNGKALVTSIVSFLHVCSTKKLLFPKVFFKKRAKWTHKHVCAMGICCYSLVFSGLNVLESDHF